MTYVLHLLSFLSMGKMDTQDVTEIFKCILAEKKIENLIRPAEAEKNLSLYVITNDLIPNDVDLYKFDQKLTFISSLDKMRDANGKYMMLDRFNVSGTKAKVVCRYDGNKIEVKLEKKEDVWKLIDYAIVKVESDKRIKVTHKKNEF